MCNETFHKRVVGWERQYNRLMGLRATPSHETAAHDLERRENSPPIWLPIHQPFKPIPAGTEALGA
jgi:hypothetical protein